MVLIRKGHLSSAFNSANHIIISHCHNFQNTHAKIDGSFIATILETAAVYALYLGWRSITEGQFSAAHRTPPLARSLVPLRFSFLLHVHTPATVAAPSQQLADSKPVQNLGTMTTMAARHPPPVYAGASI